MLVRKARLSCTSVDSHMSSFGGFCRSAGRHTHNAVAAVAEPVVESSVAVNVDQCERLFLGMFLDADAVEPNAHLISMLPNNRKPIALRDKTQIQVIRIFNSLHDMLLAEFNLTSLAMIGTSNNRMASDLYEATRKSHVELKLGSATDAALGINQLENIVGKGILEYFPSTEERDEWRKMYAKRKHGQVMKAYQQKMRGAATEINKILEVGKVVTDANSIHTLNMLYAGINQSYRIGKIKEGVRAIPEIHRFSLNRKAGWKKDVRPALGKDNQWVFEGATITKTGRLNMRFNNGSHYIRFTFNQKNSYSNKTLGIERSSGRYGLGYLSMNVWIKPIPASKKK